MFWEKYNTAIVSDLHLEKGSSFAETGQFLPPYDSEETLSKLFKILKSFQSEKLILLGDTFHDEEAKGRLSHYSQNLFYKIIDQFNPIFIKGNHDHKLKFKSLRIYDKFEMSKIQFLHKAVKNLKPQISGHYHPNISINIAGKKITTKCLIHNENIMILPSFGYFTGGLNIKNKNIQSHFKKNYYVYLITKYKILKLSSNDII